MEQTKAWWEEAWCAHIGRIEDEGYGREDIESFIKSITPSLEQPGREEGLREAREICQKERANCENHSTGDGPVREASNSLEGNAFYDGGKRTCWRITKQLDSLLSQQEGK